MPMPDHPFTFAHGLGDLGLTTDEALAALLDRYPEELLDINSYSYDRDDQVTLTTGVKGRADGTTMLAEIKAGRLWVNMRGVADAIPALWGPAERALLEATREWGMRPVKAAGQLILSSPQTRVPYHFDAGGTVLFHLRGRKRIFIYPTDEEHLPQVHMEKSIMRMTTEELPYHRALDAAVQAFDLTPGEAVTWPLYAPHRVDNLGEFNASLSIEFQTWESRVTGGAHYANGVLRNWGLTPAPMGRTPLAARALLWGGSLAMKRAGLAENRIRGIERTFAIGEARQGA